MNETKENNQPPTGPNGPEPPQPPRVLKAWGNGDGRYVYAVSTRTTKFEVKTATFPLHKRFVSEGDLKELGMKTRVYDVAVAERKLVLPEDDPVVLRMGNITIKFASKSQAIKTLGLSQYKRMTEPRSHPRRAIRNMNNVDRSSREWLEFLQQARKQAKAQGIGTTDEVSSNAT